MARDFIEHGLKPKLLVIAENFDGWEKQEVWDDVDFLVTHGDDIAKIAIVTEQRWKEQAFIFAGKGQRSTEIEFFPSTSLKEAELWVRA